MTLPPMRRTRPPGRLLLKRQRTVPWIYGVWRRDSLGRLRRRVATEVTALEQALAIQVVLLTLVMREE